MVTPNMNLDLPTVGVTIDPTWATKLNTALTAIDEHDHTSGNGVQVPTAGLNINADLSLQSNDLTDIRSLSLNNNVSTLPSGDVRAVYASSGNLYYNNNSGVAVRITNGASLDTGSLALNVWELHELAGNLTLTGSESYIFIDTDTSASRTINLPPASSVTAGRYFIIKDKTGSAATNNITISPNGSDTIDGAASSTTVNSNFGSLTLVSDGISAWLTNASTGGFLRLGGDLLGTGSTVTQPRVGSLTGISGLITFANNTALNTRNQAGSVNVNIAKMNSSDILHFGDTSYDGYLDGYALSVKATGGNLNLLTLSGNTYINSSVDTWLEAGNNIEIQAPNQVIIGAIDDCNVSAVANLILHATNDVSLEAYRDVGIPATRHISATATTGNISMTATAGNITHTATAGSFTATAGNDFTLTCVDDGYISAQDAMTVAGASLTLKGAFYVPTKAVTSSPYTVDTTTKDYVIFVDSTGGAISINLPAASNGRYLIIQDVGGAANTNNITLVRNGSDTIQGIGANYVLDADYQGVHLCAYSGASWFIVGTS